MNRADAGAPASRVNGRPGARLARGRVLDGQRGAIGLVVLLVTQLVFLGGCIGAVYVATMTAQTRALTAADAVAHASVSDLAQYTGRQALEMALQGGMGCSLSDEVPGIAPQTAGEDDPGCREAIDTARRVAQANGVRLMVLVLGADPRAYVHGDVPALFIVTAEVEAPGPLVGATVGCRDHQTHWGLCWAEAWSAAREAG